MKRLGARFKCDRPVSLGMNIDSLTKILKMTGRAFRTNNMVTKSETQGGRKKGSNGVYFICFQYSAIFDALYALFDVASEILTLRSSKSI